MSLTYRSHTSHRVLWWLHNPFHVFPILELEAECTASLYLHIHLQYSLEGYIFHKNLIKDDSGPCISPREFTFSLVLQGNHCIGFIGTNAT